ncbi:MAG: BBP7 family outer membrane beta-barrel protein [Pirellulales bacterium]|nr:BBP7 family outer membrane beta-barrel protein [Pirellulales bacterium]
MLALLSPRRSGNSRTTLAVCATMVFGFFSIHAPLQAQEENYDGDSPIYSPKESGQSSAPWQNPPSHRITSGKAPRTGRMRYREESRSEDEERLSRRPAVSWQRSLDDRRDRVPEGDSPSFPVKKSGRSSGRRLTDRVVRPASYDFLQGGNSFFSEQPVRTVSGEWRPSPPRRLPEGDSPIFSTKKSGQSPSLEVVRIPPPPNRLAALPAGSSLQERSEASPEVVPIPPPMVSNEGDWGEGGYGPEPGCGYGGTYNLECLGPLATCGGWLGGRLWFRGEYLMWWGKSAELPPLVTTSPADTPREQAGVLGQPGTSVLFGNGGVEQGLHSGGRFALGCWIDPCQVWGVEGAFIYLGNQARRFDESSSGDPILARPFLNTVSGLQDAGIVALPGDQSGTLTIRLANEFQSAEVLLRRAMSPGFCRQADFLIGYRYGRFAEDLTLDETTTYLREIGQIPVGTEIRASDGFDVTNEFHGAELGVTARMEYRRVSLEVLGKLALGNTRSRVHVDGTSTITVPGVEPITRPGGFLALPTNNGYYEQSGFSVMPELGATLGYQLTCRMKLTLGYSFLYWSRVARPGDAIDLDINPTQFPPGELSGFPAPQFRFSTTDFWMQGLNFGIDYRF